MGRGSGTGGDGTPGEEPPAATGGVVIGGSMTGGAVASGARSSARDASRRDTAVPVESLPAPAAPAVPAAPGQVYVAGHVTGGAVAAGEDSEAVHEATTTDAAHRELLAAVTLLREHLASFARTDDVAAVDAELAVVQDEIGTTGRADTGRLRWLRDRLTAAGTVLAALSSAATVAQAIQALAG
ncbi:MULTISPECIES: hypothetical protein [Streptomycetaceae]|uniref:Uncharacterized protein n=1 Tax=Streptantibioticus cattleyicolor (strain ATCC 35852 / DSM 46488 / JCM 4925 / NBRC 14057 / NRRL 8057) TaxID=1003195 RepID=F8K092_STREN|nr:MULTISPECIES: hypothetical protein [Streptomycetaceae]AEW96076.1 hypothetical protein SCATT_37050 [Streptantibioticus cattleyicolor NRRL 8057 = DSM 46488]MYS60606.1 hypothetical protein [Streptomyces sp. SID5468]CCB76412.1 conserved protein of unknown function [Streptantibioticus cattleyicolor NRRL 8057 = DSM 46488]